MPQLDRDDFTLGFNLVGGRFDFPGTTIVVTPDVDPTVDPAYDGKWNACVMVRKKAITGKKGVSFKIKAKFHDWGTRIIGIADSPDADYTKVFGFNFGGQSMADLIDHAVNIAVTVVGGIDAAPFHTMEWVIRPDGLCDLFFDGALVGTSTSTWLDKEIHFQANHYQFGKKVEYDSYVVNS